MWRKWPINTSCSLWGQKQFSFFLRFVVNLGTRGKKNHSEEEEPEVRCEMVFPIGAACHYRVSEKLPVDCLTEEVYFEYREVPLKGEGGGNRRSCTGLFLLIITNCCSAPKLNVMPDNWWFQLDIDVCAAQTSQACLILLANHWPSGNVICAHPRSQFHAWKRNWFTWMMLSGSSNYVVITSVW